MARIASGIVDIVVRAQEGDTGVGAGGTARLPHEIVYRLDLANGTANGEINRVHSVSSTFSTTPTDLDLLGSLTSQISGGAVTSFVDLAGIVIENTGSVNLLVGGDTNAVLIFSAANDVLVVPPGGIFVWMAPAGLAPVASTGDVLQIAAASGTCTGKVLLLGRSA